MQELVLVVDLSLSLYKQGLDLLVITFLWEWRLVWFGKLWLLVCYESRCEIAAAFCVHIETIMVQRLLFLTPIFHSFNELLFNSLLLHYTEKRIKLCHCEYT